MSWHLSESRTTRNLQDVANKLRSKNDLKKGDILLAYDDHVVLFVSWANKSHSQFNGIHQSSSAGKTAKITPEKSSYYLGSKYVPYRYQKKKD